ncbi:MAG: DNA repair protein RecO C-terminal domain-containing protein [Bacteroidia bacterium]|nr:DNA repair protein RecO C-terminal domain-containing protein [Bacteroidia bacterium]
MKFIQTNAIILQKTQVRDFKYILKFYSESLGLISADIEVQQYLQPAHIQIPNICYIHIIQNKYKKNTIKEIKPLYIYQTIFSNYQKNIIAQFITEIIIKTIKDEYTDPKLFKWIQESLVLLDQSDHVTLEIFHLNFLKKYIELSGLMPLNNYSASNPYFNLVDGRYTSTPSNHTLSAEDSKNLHVFLFSNNPNANHTFPVLNLTHILIDYMKYHYGLQELQTLVFLKESILEFKL